RALQTDMQLADLSFSQGDDGDAGEAQVLEQRRDVGLVAANAIERFRQHNIKLTPLCILQKRLDARPQDHARAGDGCVLVSSDNLPVLALRLLATDAELVLDGCLALIVGRVSGIKRNTCHGQSPVARLAPSLILLRRLPYGLSAGSRPRPRCRASY